MTSINNQLAALRRLAGSRIKISRIRGTDNIIIRGGGVSPVVKQINDNVGVSPRAIIMARKRLNKKRR